MPVPNFVRAVRQWTLNSISIRLRLALWYGTLLFVTLTLFSIIVFAVAEFQLDNSVDQSLQSRAQLVARTIQGELRDTGVETSSSPPASTGTQALPTVTTSPVATGQPITPFPTPVPTVDPKQQEKFQRQLQLSKPTRDLLANFDLTFEVVDSSYTIVY